MIDGVVFLEIMRRYHSLLVFVFIAIPSLNAYDIPEKCNMCMCDATRCRITKTCDVANGMKTCGLYNMTKSYWQEAVNSVPPAQLGKFSVNILDYEACCIDVVCSEIILQLYFNKNGRDCNSDGNLDCKDVYRIHTMGPERCHSPEPKDMEGWRRLQACLKLASSRIPSRPNLNPDIPQKTTKIVNEIVPEETSKIVMFPSDLPEGNRPTNNGYRPPTNQGYRPRPYNERRPYGASKPPRYQRPPVQQTIDEDEENPYGKK